MGKVEGERVLKQWRVGREKEEGAGDDGEEMEQHGVDGRRH